MSVHQSCRCCLEQGGNASFEWPRYCTRWSLGPLLHCIVPWNLHSRTFDGRTVGVTAKNMPARKPWRFVTSSARLAGRLSKLKCDHPKHDHVQGKWARLSAYYPRPLCVLMLDSLFPHVVNQHVPCLPFELQKIHSYRPKAVSGFPRMPLEEVMYEVGCKEVAVGVFVHPVLDRKEWKGRPEVQDAIDAEKNRLLQEGTWLESEIIS